MILFVRFQKVKFADFLGTIVISSFVFSKLPVLISTQKLVVLTSLFVVFHKSSRQHPGSSKLKETTASAKNLYNSLFMDILSTY
jgi:hypothetical protein